MRQPLDVFIKHLFGGRVARLGAVDDDFRVDLLRVAAAARENRALRVLLHRALGLADDGRRGSIALKAALVAAGARLAVHLDNHVADFRTDAVHAGIRLAVDDDAAAPARAQRDKHARFRALAHARDGFGVARHRRIVIDDDPVRQIFAHLRHKRNLVPAEVGAKRDDSRLGVAYARHAHADGRNIRHRDVRLLRHILAQRRDIADDRLIRALLHRRGRALG